MLSLKGLAAPGSRAVVRCRRRCLSATATLPRWLPPRASAAPIPWTAPAALRLGPHLVGCSRQQTRGLATVDRLRAWFLDGPEAAAPVTPTSAVAGAGADAGSAAAFTLPPPPPADEAAASFFVEDTPVALQEFLEGASSAAEQLATSAAVEPSFASLGLLSGLWPTNVQLKILEVLHVSLDAPWWLCAVALGIGVRLILVLPNMHMQRLMRVDLPKFNFFREFMDRASFAARTGNVSESLRIQQRLFERFPDLTNRVDLRKFIRRMGITMATNFVAMSFVQVASIRAIYRATALPVESLQHGGLLWIGDLTCIDPFFVLPAAITALLMLNVRFYFKTVTSISEQMLLVKPLAYTLLPTFVFTCLLTLPGANLFYFLATGCTAQIIHRINSSEAGKAFWKARIGLPLIEEMPPPPSALSRLAAERIRTDILPAIKNRDYQTTRLSDGPGDAQRPKTFRIRASS